MVRMRVKTVSHTPGASTAWLHGVRPGDFGRGPDAPA